MDLQTLRHRLARRAADVDAAPGDLHQQVLDGHRTQRRNRIGLGALTAFVLAVAVLVPLTLGEDRAGRAATPSGAPVTIPAAPGDPVVPHQAYDLPPRGSLAGNAAYVSGLLERPWYESADAAHALDGTEQVLFAGEVPGGVWALVSGSVDGRRMGVWLHGPTGAAPDELRADGEPVVVADDEPTSYLRTVDGVGALVVLAGPGDTVELSAGQEITADGSAVRAPFEEVGDADGVAVVDAATLSPATVELRVSREGRVVYSGPVQGSAQEGSGAGPSSSVEQVGPETLLLSALVDGVLEELGLTAGQVTNEVIWIGPIGNGNRPDVLAGVFTVRLPTGAVVAVGGYSDVQQPGGGDELTSVMPCLRQVLPAGTELTAVAMRCDLYDIEDGAALGSRLVVVPPAGAAQLRLVGVSGAVLDTRPVEGPAWVGAAPDGLGSVTALDGDGQVVAEIPLGAVEPLRD